jgi:hypothetical protein
MQKTWSSTVLGLAAMLAPILLVACSSGGGGGSSPSPAAATPVTTPPASTSSTTGSAVITNDTGIAGTVAAPAPATFGSAPAQTASSGGPTFDGTSGGYPSNVTFPLILTSLQRSSTGLSTVSGNQGATATVVSTSASSSIMQLTIPSLGVNDTLTFHSNLVSHLGQLTDGLSYAVMGGWQTLQQGQTGPLQSTSSFVFGYETPPAGVPTSGTAVFSGGPGSVAASIFKTVGTGIQSSYAEGSASFSVNFGSGAIAGSFTKMQQFVPCCSTPPLPWNDVSVTAIISAGTNKFSGSTAAASAPGTTFSLAGSATGRIDGAFYGPAAQNLGAVWSLSDGSGSVLGTVVAGH